jgi:outer membrane protein assembly factor BamB
MRVTPQNHDGNPQATALLLTALLGSFFVACNGGGACQEGMGRPPITTSVAHRFLKSGARSQSVAIVAADGSVEWEYDTDDETGDSWLLPNGNVVFSFSKGVREVTTAGTTVWEYLVPSGAESHSCQPLPNDLFLIADARSDGTSYLYEIGRDLTISKTIAITATGRTHDKFRQVRKTPAGTYLVTYQHSGAHAEEYDGDGNLLRTFPCGRYVAIRLPDGNTLIACGDDHRIIEVDPTDQIVWEVKENDIPGNKLLFAAGLQRLPNGDTVVANWAGHVACITTPQVFEITRDKEVVWEVADLTLNYISSIAILDDDAAVNDVLLR